MDHRVSVARAGWAGAIRGIGFALAWGGLLAVASPVDALAEENCTGRWSAATPPVQTIDALQTALNTACPGSLILVAPGVYHGRIWIKSGVNGTAERPIVVRAQRGLGSVTIDGMGTDITWKFSGSSYIEVSGLQITGGGYHGVFFDFGAHNILFEGNRVFDNHRTGPLDSHSEIKGSGGNGRPRRIVIRNNEIFHTRHPPGGNFQGIDCNFCRDFRIVGNHIHDINSPTSQPYSIYDRGSCIQMKSASTRTVIDGNLVERCHIGIVLGGEGLASPETLSGLVQNNIVLNADDIGIAVVNSRNARLIHNTVLGSRIDIHLGRDRGFDNSRNSGFLANNLLSNNPVIEDGKGVQRIGNVINSELTPEKLFADTEGGDFSLSAAAKDLVPGLVGDVLCPSLDFLKKPRACGKAGVVGAVAR